MKISAFVQLRRTLTPTGVGIHIIEMARGLAAQPDVELRLLVSRKELDVAGRILRQYPLHDFPADAFPLGRAWMERLWRVLRWPPAERWCGQADWLYSPAEAFVPTRRIPQAVTIHDMYPSERDLPWSDEASHRAKGKRWNGLIRLILSQARVILAVSQFTKERIVALTGCDPQRIVVTGNGVSQAYYDLGAQQAQGSPCDAPACAGAGPYVLVVGGLTKRKRGDSILAVAKQLHESKSDLRVLVAGKSREHFAQQAGALPNVQLLGYVDDAQLPQLVGAARCLLFLSQYEGFGMPAAEAMAAGTPVVVSHHAALPEIVGDAGVIVDPQQTQAIAGQVTQLHRDAALRREYQQRGRQRAEHYTWAACVERLLGALRQ